MRPSRPTALLLAAAVVPALTACGGSEPGAADAAAGSSETLLVYSGRNEHLVQPVLDRLQEAVGVPVEVRYASSSEMAAQLLEEGESTEADLFFSQDAGALGALAKAGMLAEIDPQTTALVPQDYRDPEGRWIATSARARVLAYDPAQVPDIESYTGIDQVLDPALKGKIAYAPSNASFHAFVTALRVDRGEDGAREWLEAFAQQNPEAYDNNIAVLDAVDAGEAAIGLINHYYWYRKVAELGEDEVDARIHFLDSDDPGALVNVAGAGVLASTDQPEVAQEAVRFLLSEETQTYFADETAEYPVVEGISSTAFDLEPLSELDSHQIDLNRLDSLETTLALLDEVGLT